MTFDHDLYERIIKIISEFNKELDIECREEFIGIDDLRTFEEFFITSTTKEITPIIKIDSFPLSGNKPGKLTVKLQNAFRYLTK